MSKSIKIKAKAPKARSATALPAMMRNSAGPMRDRRERRDNEPVDWLDDDDMSDYDDAVMELTGSL